jgi:hypothetical protein
MAPVTAPVPDLILYGRPGCHLCEEALGAVRLVLGDRASRSLPVPRLVEVDIESDDALLRTFLERIPVVDLGGRRLELVISASKLRRFVEDALDGPTA